MPAFLVRGDVYFWRSLMSAYLIASLPIAILHNFFLDRSWPASRWRDQVVARPRGVRRRDAVW